VTVDAGNFIEGPGELSKIKSKYVSKTLEILNFSAINIGEKDIAFGPEFLLSLKNEFHLPLVSANIKYRNTLENFVDPYIIVKIDEISCAIFGLLQETVEIASDRSQSLIVVNPIQTARLVVTELRPKCDYIIALSQLSLNGNRNLAKQVPGINLIISSQGYLTTDPIRVDSTILVQGKSKGEELNRLKIQFNPVTRQQFVADHYAQKLDGSVDNAPDIQRVLSEYKLEYRNYLQKQLAK